MRPRWSLALLLCTFVLTIPLLAAKPSKKPNNREWNLLQADYTWLETMRKSAPQPPPNASRKQQIEVLLDNLKKLEPVFVPFHEKLLEYVERTGDPRAASLYASEKIRLGDQYMNVLSRYDKALSLYRSALAIDPSNIDAKQRIAVAEAKKFVSIDAFASVKNGMKDADVRQLVGMPPEDWIKQVVQNKRAYAVWIYPKSDGGAAAIYFDSGVVYHTNWNAAPPPAQAEAKQKAEGEGVR